MKPYAADRPHPRQAGWLLVALCAAAMLVLVGCGNEPTYNGGLTVTYGFDGGGTSSTAGTSGRMLTWDSTLGEAIKTIIIGAVIVDYRQTPYTDVTEITGDQDRDTLIDAAVASLKYLDPVQLGEVGDDQIVSFPLPPDSAGNWQVIAVGLRNTRTELGDIQDTDPIWFGFIPEFLNGKLQPDEQYEGFLTLKPWCAPDNPLPPNPAPIANPGCLTGL